MRCLKRNWNYKKLIPYFCIVALSLVLLISLLNKKEFWTGYDTYFHMNGVYEDAMQIKTGHFSYFLSLFSFEKGGRIVNGLYGPIFNYFCGVFLLLCHNWIRYEFWTFFITLVLGGCEVYWCAKTLHISNPISTVLSMFYLISEPVLLYWVANFAFSGFGATDLLPLVILVGIKIFQQGKIKIIPLAILMAICLQIHLMTSIIATLTLIIFTFSSFLLSSRKYQMAKNGVLATLLAFCLSGNIFGAIYDVYSTNHIIPTFPNFHLQRAVNHSAIYLDGLHITELGHLYTLFLLIIITLMIFRFKSTEILDWCLLVEDILFLWISSIYFPWDKLLKLFPWLASVIQFPSRFMSISFLTTLLLVGRVLMEAQLRPKYAVWGLIILFIIAFHSSISTLHHESQVWQSPQVIRYWTKTPKNYNYLRHSNRIRKAFRSYDLSRGINVAHKITTDYMPTPHQINLHRYYHYPINKEYTNEFQHQKGFHKYIQDDKLVMNWHSDRCKLMTIPLVKYSNTVVKLNNKCIYPKQNLIGTMRIRSRKGKNNVSIQYRPGIIFKALTILSVLSWLVVMALFLFMA